MDDGGSLKADVRERKEAERQGDKRQGGQCLALGSVREK